MNTKQSILTVLTILCVISVLALSAFIIDYEERDGKIIVIQGNSKYRTDKIDSINNGIKFKDHLGKNVEIKGNYIIERHGN